VWLLKIRTEEHGEQYVPIERKACAAVRLFDTVKKPT
jgi:hypothetical protein